MTVPTILSAHPVPLILCTLAVCVCANWLQVHPTTTGGFMEHAWKCLKNIVVSAAQIFVGCSVNAISSDSPVQSA